jgi:hypothetical protein
MNGSCCEEANTIHCAKKPASLSYDPTRGVLISLYRNAVSDFCDKLIPENLYKPIEPDVYCLIRVIVNLRSTL